MSPMDAYSDNGYENNDNNSANGELSEAEGEYENYLNDDSENENIQPSIGRIHVNDQYNDYEHDNSPRVRFDALATEEYMSGYDTEVQFGMLRPERGCDKTRCIVQMVKINGLDALTMFNSGCTTDAVSPEFARVAKLKDEVLTDAIPL